MCNWGLFFPFLRAYWDTSCSKLVYWNASISTCELHHHECSVYVRFRKHVYKRKEKYVNSIIIIITIHTKKNLRKYDLRTCFWNCIIHVIKNKEDQSRIIRHLAHLFILWYEEHNLIRTKIIMFLSLWVTCHTSKSTWQSIMVLP